MGRLDRVYKEIEEEMMNRHYKESRILSSYSSRKTPDNNKRLNFHGKWNNSSDILDEKRKREIRKENDRACVIEMAVIEGSTHSLERGIGPVDKEEIEAARTRLRCGLNSFWDNEYFRRMAEEVRIAIESKCVCSLPSYIPRWLIQREQEAYSCMKFRAPYF